MGKDICSAFGRRIRELRSKRKWSQEELAHRIGMDDGYLSDLETGKKEPCLRKIQELAEGLGVTLAAIFKDL